MNWIDFSTIIFLLLSGVVSYFYGFVKELFSFLAWLIALIVALVFLGMMVGLLDTLFPALLPYDDLRLGVAFIALFFVSFILLELINYLILNYIGPTHSSVPDQVLGIFFGVSRGCVIIIFLMILAGLTNLPARTWWQESMFIQQFKPIVLLLRSQLPSEVATKLEFDPPPEFLPPSF